MQEELEKRWRLVLGSETKEEFGFSLTKQEQGIDNTLQALYNSDRRGGLGPSSPNVSRWLGDIREYFPNTVVKVMHQFINYFSYNLPGCSFCLFWNGAAQTH